MASLFDTVFIKAIVDKIVHNIYENKLDELKSILEQMDDIVRVFCQDKERMYSFPLTTKTMADLIRLEDFQYLSKTIFKGCIETTSGESVPYDGTLLHIACQSPCKKEIITYLVKDRGFDFDAVHNSLTPLQIALQRHKYDVAEYFLENGAVLSKETCEKYLFGYPGYFPTEKVMQHVAESRVVDLNDANFSTQDGLTFKSSMDACFHTWNDDSFCMEAYNMLKKYGVDPKRCLSPILLFALASEHVTNEDIATIKADGFTINQTTIDRKNAINLFVFLTRTDKWAPKRVLVRLAKEMRENGYDGISSKYLPTGFFYS